MEKENQYYLAVEKVGRLIGKYAVPCIISLLVGALYNIVDQIFIANASILSRLLRKCCQHGCVSVDGHRARYCCDDRR